MKAFVFLSASPNLRRSAPLVRYKREVERAVRTSGMRWTIVQPSAFMDVWFSPMIGWDHVAGRAMVFGPGTAPLSWISVADVAAHVCAAIDDERVANVELPLGGPETLSTRQVVRVLRAGLRSPVLVAPRAATRAQGAGADRGNVRRGRRLGDVARRADRRAAT